MPEKNIATTGEGILTAVIQSPPFLFEKTLESVNNEFMNKVTTAHTSETLSFSYLLNSARTRHLITLKGPLNHEEHLVETLKSRLLTQLPDTAESRIIDWNFKNLEFNLGENRDPPVEISTPEQIITAKQEPPTSKPSASRRKPRKFGVIWVTTFAIIGAILATVVMGTANKRFVGSVRAEEIAKHYLDSKNLNDAVLAKHAENSSSHILSFSTGSNKFIVKVDCFGNIVAYTEDHIDEDAN